MGDETAGLINFLQNRPTLEDLSVHFDNKCLSFFVQYLAKKAQSLLANCSKLREYLIIQVYGYYHQISQHSTLEDSHTSARHGLIPMALTFQNWR